MILPLTVYCTLSFAQKNSLALAPLSFVNNLTSMDKEKEAREGEEDPTFVWESCRRDFKKEISFKNYFV